MKLLILRAGVMLAVLGFALTTTFAQTTAFTYQGQLRDGNVPANGLYDLQFTLWATNTTGSIIAGPLTNSATSVSNGLFTVALDFGSVFNGTNYWLEIAVGTNGNHGFTTLSPRQPIAPTPYAMYAANSARADSLSAAATNINVNAATVGDLHANNVFWSSGGALVDSQGGSLELGDTGLPGATPFIDFHYGMFPGGSQDYNVRLINDADQQLSVMGNLNVSGSVSGNGSGLFNLNVAQLSGILPAAQLPSNVAFQQWPNNFIPVTSGATLGVGSVPVFVTAADVNGDGKMDLISVNKGDSSLTILTNDGSGGFAVSQVAGVGPNPTCVAVADVNGDGKKDLIAVNQANSTLTVLTNNGSGGTFSFSQSLSTTTGGLNYPAFVAAADVNGDGKIDLISANDGSNSLTVLTNNGNGTFSFSQTLNVGEDPVAVVAADVNGDGKMDLIAANEVDFSLSVLTNNGSGGFALAQNAPVTGPLLGVVAVDLNNDGRPDLITANYDGSSGPNISVLTNNNDGSGTFTSSQNINVGDSHYSVAAGDFNGDGKIDLVAANLGQPGYNGTSTVSIMTNNGAAVFTLAQTASVGTVPYSVTTADVNGDGRADIITANYYDNTLSVLLASAQITNQVFTSANLFTSPANVFTGNGSALTGLNASAISSGTFGGNGSGLTNLDATKLTGQLSVTNLPATVVTNNATGVTLAGTFNGNGSGLTNLNAAKLTGQISVTNLSATVVTNNATGVTLTGTFNGSGSGLTNLNAAKLTGQVTLTNLPAALVTNNATGVTLSGTFNGNGAGLTNIALLNNVALLNSNQLFTGFNTFVTTNFVISNSVANPVLTVIGRGGSGSTVALNLNTYVVGTNPPSSQILATDDGNFGNTLDVLTKTDGNILNALVSRLRIFGNGNVLIPGNVTNSGSMNVTGGINVTGGLNVTGSARIGGNPATVGVESLRIIRGEIAGNGVVDFGSGFTVTRNGTGDFTVHFTTAFASTPSFTATTFGNVVFPTLFINNASSVQLKFYNVSTTATDPNGFDFIAVGP